MQTYKIKEMFYTLQGEGFHAGRPAVFCRFAGCNLWSGREEDRDKAVCKFCDTDFWGTDGQNGGKYTAEQLISKILTLWPDPKISPFVVCTGGEPALQMDTLLVEAMHKASCIVAIETNGTIPLPTGIDWVCVSPKADATVVVTSGDELKLVFPQSENRPENFEHLDFAHFYIQPLDDSNTAQNTRLSVEYCLANPHWKLSLQTHKVLGID